MTIGSELEGVAKWIYNRITSNAGIMEFVKVHPVMNMPQVYFNLAPEGSRVPYCVFTYLGGSSKNASSGRKIFKRLKFSVQFVTVGDSVAHVLPFVARLEVLFQNDQMSESIVIMGSRVESDFSITDILDGGVTTSRTGIIISVSAYAQRPVIIDEGGINL